MSFGDKIVTTIVYKLLQSHHHLCQHLIQLCYKNYKTHFVYIVIVFKKVSHTLL